MYCIRHSALTIALVTVKLSVTDYLRAENEGKLPVYLKDRHISAHEREETFKIIKANF